MEKRTPFTDVLRTAVEDITARDGVPGAAVALVIDGHSVSLSVGTRDADGRYPLERDAQVSLYSVTKTVLAAASLRLVEQGRLALDRPLAPEFPGIPLDPAITLRHLLSHTSGLPDYGGMPEYHDDLKADPTAPWTTDEFLARTLPRGLRFPPGEGWAYSNIGFLLVRLAIERATGGTLGNAFSDLLFRPLGLRQTTVAESLADAGLLTPGFSTSLSPNGELKDISRRYHPGWVSHGLVVSTAAEVARFVEALFNGEVIGPAALAEMTLPRAAVGPHPTLGEIASGLGIFILPGWKHGHLLGHGGGGPGYSTAAFHARDLNGHRVTAVALANRDRDDIGHEIALALLDVAARHLNHERLDDAGDLLQSGSPEAGGENRT